MKLILLAIFLWLVTFVARVSALVWRDSKKEIIIILCHETGHRFGKTTRLKPFGKLRKCMCGNRVRLDLKGGQMSAEEFPAFREYLNQKLK